MVDKANDTATQSDGSNDKTPEELRTLKSELEHYKGKIKTYETDIAHLQHKVATLTDSKKNTDKVIEGKAKEGDQESIELIKRQMRDEFAANEESLKTKAQQLDTELKQERVIGKAMTKAANLFNQDALEFIQIKVQKHCDYKDGQIIVNDDKGEIRYSENNRRELLTLDEYLLELSDKHPSLAKATSNNGTKDSGEKRDGNFSKMTFEQYSRLSPSEQRKANISPAVAREWLQNFR